MNTIPRVARVERSIFPDGQAVLTAYGDDGEFLLGLPCKPKGPVWKWAAAGGAGDRRHMEAAVREHYGQTQGSALGAT